MKMQDISGIGRPLDPDYPTNRAIGIITVVVIVAGLVYHFLTGGLWWQNILQALGDGGAVFLAWAICREIDPDHDLAAFVAVALSLLGLGLLGLPHFGVLFWILLVARILNRTTGLPATYLDSLIAVGLGSWLTALGNWGYGLATSVALIADGLLPAARRHQLYLAGVALIATGLVAALVGPTHWFVVEPLLVPGYIAIAISLAFTPIFIETSHLYTVGDETGEPLSSQRVHAAQALTIVMGIEAAFWQSYQALRWWMPFWAAILGAAIWWAYRRVRGPSAARET